MIRSDRQRQKWNSEELIGGPAPTRAHQAPSDPAEEEASAEEDLAELARVSRKASASCTFLSRALSDDQVTLGLVSALRSNPPRTGTDLDSFAASLRAAGGADDEETLARASRSVIEDHDAAFAPRRDADGKVDPSDPRHGTVCPIESLNVGGADADQVRASVRDAYRQHGFGPDRCRYVPAPGTPIDHICVELAFLASLGDDCASSVERVLAGETDDDPDEKTRALYDAESALNDRLVFIEDHLLAWVPQFCDQLEAAASTSFYRGIAQLLRLLVLDETRNLGELDTTAAV